jgi:hypothetical protein
VRLRDVYCRATEDIGWLGSEDELYITGAFVAGNTKKVILTGILDIDNGQTKQFSDEDSLIFDGDLPDGTAANLAIRVFDQDSGAEWQNRRELIDNGQAVLDRKIRERQQQGQWGEIDLAAIVQFLGDVLQSIAGLDQDDNLGGLTWRSR